MHQFPEYRKFAHGRTFFKITSESHFEELQLMGQFYQLSALEATIFPDYQRITDMLENEDGYFENSTEDEWQEKLKFAESSLRRMA